MNVSPHRMLERAKEVFDLGDYFGCIHLLEELIEGGRGFADAHHLLGLAYQMAGRSERALESFDVALNLNPQYVPQSPYPATSRDFNLIVDETTRWSDLLATVRSAGGETIEQVEFREPFRDPKDGPAKKRILLAVSLRAADRTLRSEEAENISDAIVSACAQRLGAKLLS